MLRFWLVLLLLANYLLVVGAGLVNRPEPPLHSAAHPYTHSANCQQKHYLQVDCFDRCNGNQQAVQKRTTGENAQHLLSVIKGIDAHCLTEMLHAEPVFYSIAAVVPAAEAVAAPTGFATLIYAPPRRG